MRIINRPDRVEFLREFLEKAVVNFYTAQQLVQNAAYIAHTYLTDKEIEDLEDGYIEVDLDTIPDYVKPPETSADLENVVSLVMSSFLNEVHRQRANNE